jgi:thioredoxin 1
MASKNVNTFETATFDKDVLKSEVPVLVDFWAAWCAPCRAIAPSVEALAEQYAGQVKVGKVDIDAHPDVAQSFGVRSIPTLIIFKQGAPVGQIVGSVPKARIEEMIKNSL